VQLNGTVDLAGVMQSESFGINCQCMHTRGFARSSTGEFLRNDFGVGWIDKVAIPCPDCMAST
jgi:hypothetical protein